MNPKLAMEKAREIAESAVPNHFNRPDLHALIDAVRSDIQDALIHAHNAAIDAALASVAREQDYREYREDQDGSAIGACKEIAGYLRLLKVVSP